MESSKSTKPGCAKFFSFTKFTTDLFTVSRSIHLETTWLPPLKKEHSKFSTWWKAVPVTRSTGPKAPLIQLNSVLLVTDLLQVSNLISSFRLICNWFRYSLLKKWTMLLFSIRSNDHSWFLVVCWIFKINIFLYICLNWHINISQFFQRIRF